MDPKTEMEKVFVESRDALATTFSALEKQYGELSGIAKEVSAMFASIAPTPKDATPEQKDAIAARDQEIKTIVGRFDRLRGEIRKNEDQIREVIVKALKTMLTEKLKALGGPVHDRLVQAEKAVERTEGHASKKLQDFLGHPTDPKTKLN